MKKTLELIRAALVVSAVPVVLTFYATAGTWHTVLFVYVVGATLVLLVLNHLLKEDPARRKSLHPQPRHSRMNVRSKTRWSGP